MRGLTLVNRLTANAAKDLQQEGKIHFENNLLYVYMCTGNYIQFHFGCPLSIVFIFASSLRTYAQVFFFSHECLFQFQAFYMVDRIMLVCKICINMCLASLPLTKYSPPREGAIHDIPRIHTLYYITLHYSTVHYTTLHYITYITLHTYKTSQNITKHNITLHYIQTKHT